MPNMCVGDLRIRGKKENIKRFLMEGLKVNDINAAIFGDDEDDDFEVYSSKSFELPQTESDYIKGLSVCIDGKDEELKTVAVEMNCSWDIDANLLLKYCKEYSLDMRIYAFERGQRFNRNIEIINGKIIIDKTIYFSDYVWECICPNLGG